MTGIGVGMRANPMTPNDKIRHLFIWLGRSRAVPGAMTLRLLLAAVLYAWTGVVVAQPDPYAPWTDATVYRDEWGTPHIYASTPRHLAFAFGYAQAEDHLEAMLVAYRVANGRAAEALGESFAQSDEFAWKMQHGVLAQDAMTRADALTRDLCEGFAAGANAYMADHPAETPPWADGVRAADILALLHCYLMSQAPFDLPGQYSMPAASFSGNAWALAPSRSATGEAILAINPHMYFDRPFRWYEAHLVSQDYNVAGATIFGLPVILQGHNDSVGWGLTPNFADFADIYAESAPEMQRNPAAVNTPVVPPEAILYGQMLARTRTYYVLTATGLQPRTVPCLFSPRGPIVGEHQGRLAAYQIGGYAQFGALRQFVEMGRARNLQSFQAALSMHQLPCFHIVYADRFGSIFYLYNAIVGERRGAGNSAPKDDALRIVDYSLPLPGENEQYHWGRLIPVAALPSITNPPSGYLQACGNPPWLATENAPINPANLPGWLVHDYDTYRAKRARHLLRIGPRSFEDMQSMLYDTLVPFAIDSVPGILKTAEESTRMVSNAHPDLPVGLQLFSDWNYAAEIDSPGMTFFHIWWSTLSAAASGRFRTDWDLMEAVRQGAPKAREAALTAAGEAAKLMRNEYQSLSVPWGDVHRVQRGNRSEPLAGGSAGEPIFYSSDFRLQNGKWTANYGYGFAMVIRFGDLPEAVSMVPFGASEKPGTKHYDDQLNLMLDRRFKRNYYRQEDVISHATTGFGRIVVHEPGGLAGHFVVRTPTPVASRLAVTLDPPGPLPEGLAAFTLFSSPQDLPVGLSIQIDGELHVAPELCDAKDLPKLAPYAFDDKNGWQPVTSHVLDEKTATFQLRDESPRTYAILGPLTALKTAVKPAVAVPTPERAEEPESPSALFKIARELPDPASLGAPINPGNRTAGSSEAPLVPSPQSTASALPQTQEVVKAPDSPGAPVVPMAAQTPADTQMPADTQPTEASTVPPAPEQTPPSTDATQTQAGAESSPGAVSETQKPSTEQEVVRIDRAALEKGVNKPPVSKPAEPAATSASDEMKMKAVGPPGSGKVIDLRTPDGQDLFLLEASTTIEARLVVLAKSPGPLPEGLAVFSEYIGLERIPKDAKAHLTLKLIVPESICAAKDLDQLKLYGYRVGKGWYEAPGQKVLNESHAVTAFDDVGKDLRVYAVLGPQSLRKAP